MSLRYLSLGLAVVVFSLLFSQTSEARIFGRRGHAEAGYHHEQRPYTPYKGNLYYNHSTHIFNGYHHGYKSYKEYSNAYYPKYYGGFHARHFDNYGYPSGDIGLRGTPW